MDKQKGLFKTHYNETFQPVKQESKPEEVENPVKAKRPTQHDRIINYLKVYEKLDRITAFTKLGIFELSARIGELEKKGFEFEITQVNRRTVDGEIIPCKEYRLRGVA